MRREYLLYSKPILKILSIFTVTSVILAASATAPATARAQIPLGDITIELDLAAAGLTAPVFATHAGDGSGRLFVVDQIGQIRIIKDGALLPTSFLDLTAEIVSLNSSFDERGLLGLAFHPNYRSNGRFFVRYSKPRHGDPSELCFGTTRGCHEEILSEFRVSSDPDVANVTTERILFRIDQPQFNNNAGHVAFGPFPNRAPRSDQAAQPARANSFLFFSLGDGGGANDGLADTPPSHGPIGHGQNIETNLGAILRIDVDGTPDPGLEYAIPPDNPFVGMPGQDEIYAYGMRNPYRFSFDNGLTGDGALYLADVGQNLFEEVNIIEKGGNYGWVIREGFHCFDPFNPTTPLPSCPGLGLLGEPLIDPIAEYDHGDGLAVIGGFVYRGLRFPELRGKYVFGDFSRTFVPGNGRLFWLDPDGDPSQIFEFQLGNPHVPLTEYVKGFGQDEEGEIYVLTSGNLGPTGNTGKVYRIVRP